MEQDEREGGNEAENALLLFVPFVVKYRLGPEGRA